MNILIFTILGAILLSIGFSMLIVSLCIVETDRVDQKIRTYDFEKTKMRFISKK